MPGMSAHAHPHDNAATEDLVRALRGCGVLTRNGLRDAARAGHWESGAFELGLKHAVATGRIRALTPDLFELSEAERKA
jgi:hypothetical protein